MMVSWIIETFNLSSDSMAILQLMKKLLQLSDDSTEMRIKELFSRSSVKFLNVQLRFSVSPLLTKGIRHRGSQGWIQRGHHRLEDPQAQRRLFDSTTCLNLQEPCPSLLENKHLNTQEITDPQCETSHLSEAAQWDPRSKKLQKDQEETSLAAAKTM